MKLLLSNKSPWFWTNVKDSKYQNVNYLSINQSLLDKVMSRNQWHIGVHQRHLMFKGHWRTPHQTIYAHKRKVCLDKTFPLGHFMLHFIMFLCIYVTVLSLLEMHSGGNVRRPRCRPFSLGVLGASDLILLYYWGGLCLAAPMGSGPCSAVLRHLRAANALVRI